MEEYRLLILLSNLMGELYTKSFDCNKKEFEDWLRIEIGFTESELEYIKNNSAFGNIFEEN